MSEIDWRNEYSDDEIEQAFGEAFEELAKYNDVSTWEGLVEWDGDEMTLVLEVTSMAGDLTKERFEENDDLMTVAVRMYDGVEVVFGAREVLTINGTDYRAIYAPVAETDSDEEVEVEFDDVEDDDGVDDVEDEDEDIEDGTDLTGAGNVGWEDIVEE